MVQRNNFQICVDDKGCHIIRCQVYPDHYSILNSVFSMFPIISELEWFKKEIIKAKIRGERTYAGQNTLDVYVTGDNTTIGFGFDKNSNVDFSTKTILDFIDQSIEFHKLYEKGYDLGVIPESKKDNLIIVPKEFVKDEYWKTQRTLE